MAQIHAILDQLNIHEWRPTMAHLEQGRLGRSYDIVGSLPVELLIQVGGRLNPTDIVRCQRVRITSISKPICFDKAVLGLEAMARSFFVRCSYQTCFASNFGVFSHGGWLMYRSPMR